MSAGHTPMARYTLHIVADSGYESTTEGQCTPHQYSMAIAALMGAPHTSQELKAQRDELLEALSLAEHTFRHYANLHAAKGPEGADKARRNTELADRMEAAIAKHTPTAAPAATST